MSDLKDGSYFPEWMVLRLPDKHLWLFLENHPGPNDMSDRARSVGTFFHEWIHHYHNVSTVSGILSFATTLSLWQSFRWTVVEPFCSAGSEIESLPPAHRLEIERASQYYNFLHNKRACNEILNKSAGSAGFAIFDDPAAVTLVPATTLRSVPGQESAEVFHVIRCEARRLRPGSTTNAENVTVEIGPQEIMEGITSTLEQNLVSRISPGSTVETMKFAPYKLLDRVAQHFLPDISSDLIVACGIASLQFADPPRMLLDLL